MTGSANCPANAPARRRGRPATAGMLAAALLALVALPGCGLTRPLGIGSPSGLSVRGQVDPTGPVIRLQGDFDRAWYRHDDPNTATFVLLDGPEDAPRQAAVLRLFWRPRPGLTPLERTATNSTCALLIFAQRGRALGGTPGPDFGEVGIYTGAGFLQPAAAPGGATLTAEVWEATLRLDTGSAGFADLLGQATMSGSFQAQRNPAKVGQLLKDLQRAVTERLGRPRLVLSRGPAAPA